MGNEQRFYVVPILFKCIHRLPVHSSSPFSLSRDSGPPLMPHRGRFALQGASPSIPCSCALLQEEPLIGLVSHPHAFFLLIAGKLLLYYLWKRERRAYQFDEQVTKGERFRVKRGGNHK